MKITPIEDARNLMECVREKQGPNGQLVQSWRYKYNMPELQYFVKLQLVLYFFNTLDTLNNSELFAATKYDITERALIDTRANPRAPVFTVEGNCPMIAAKNFRPWLRHVVKTSEERNVKNNVEIADAQQLADFLAHFGI